jgi:hypothetical protein
MNTTTVNPKSRLHRMPLEPALGRMDRGLGNAGGLGCRSRIMMDATSNIVRKFQAVLSFGVATGWCC